MYSEVWSFLCFVHFVSCSKDFFFIYGHEDVTCSLILWFLSLCEHTSWVALCFMSTGLIHANLDARVSAP